MTGYMPDNMLAEINAQRDARDYLTAIESDLTAVAERFEEVQTVHMVGSGDSLFAGRAVEPFLRTMNGPEFRTHTAFEFAEYVASTVDSSDLVVPISESGNSTQTVKAAKQADENGAPVAGLTNAKDGILYQDFPDSILLGIDGRPGWVPGTVTYLGLVATLYHLGIRFAGDGDAERNQIETLYRSLESVGEVVDASKDLAHEVAKNLVYTDSTPPIYVLGGGPSLATAEYVSAKFVEMGLPKTLAIGQESEEFAHKEFWTLEKTNPVFVVAPQGDGFGRTREIAEGIREFGNDLVIVTDSSDLARLGKYAFEIEIENDLFSPLLTAIPLQLVVYYYTVELGLDANNGTHVDPHRIDVADTIHSGKRYE